VNIGVRFQLGIQFVKEIKTVVRIIFPGILAIQNHTDYARLAFCCMAGYLI